MHRLGSNTTTLSMHMFGINPSAWLKHNYPLHAHVWWKPNYSPCICLVQTHAHIWWKSNYSQRTCLVQTQLLSMHMFGKIPTTLSMHMLGKISSYTLHAQTFVRNPATAVYIAGRRLTTLSLHKFSGSAGYTHRAHIGWMRMAGEAQWIGVWWINLLLFDFGLLSTELSFDVFKASFLQAKSKKNHKKKVSNL